MEKLYSPVLVLHIVTGFLALLCGILSVSSKKGARLHRFSGTVFFWSMLGVCLSALFICLLKGNTFLLLIGGFSFYMAYTGFRAVKEKSLLPNWMDKLVMVMAAITTFFMLASMNMILMVFGVLAAWNLFQQVKSTVDLRKGKTLPEKLWLERHIGMMMGAFIATTTAFLVVNSNLFDALGLPAWFWWFLPSALLVPLIFYFIKKFAPKTESEKGDQTERMGIKK
jgi:hypothetical protein